MVQTQSMINTGDILYIEPNKNRTNTWLVANRLQLPLHITKYGPIKSVSYSEPNVNTFDKKSSKNNISHNQYMQDEEDYTQIKHSKESLDSYESSASFEDEGSRIIDEAVRSEEVKEKKKSSSL